MSSDKPDYYAMAEGISKTIGKVTKPLTDAQFIALAGAVAVYVEKALAHEAEKQAGPVAGQASAPAPVVPAGWRDAMQEALSVCDSVSMSRDRRVVREGCVLYLQTEEWCKWAEQEVAPKLRQALEAVTVQAPAAPSAPPSESDKEDAELLLRRLVEQIEKAEFIEENGHRLKMNVAYLAAKEAL